MGQLKRDDSETPPPPRQPVTEDQGLTFVRRWPLGGVKDGDPVAVLVRDGVLTINGWPVKVSRLTYSDNNDPGCAFRNGPRVGC